MQKKVGTIQIKMGVILWFQKAMKLIDFIRTLDSTIYNLAVNNDDSITFHRLFTLI